MNVIDWLQWPAMAATIGAAWLVASSHRAKRNAGFWVFLLSNALWVVWALYADAPALIVMQVGLAALNIRGAIKTGFNWLARAGNCSMKRFTCERCRHAVYFENVRCEKCLHALGYSSESNEMLSLESTPQDRWTAVSGSEFRYCANARLDACNWLIPTEASADRALCSACALNRTIPDVTITENLERWKRLEVAKHRLVYSLQRLGLPMENGHDHEGGLLFDLLSGYAEDGQEKSVTTGHENGVITIDVSEGDPTVRTERRQHLGERFRTLLGHFRHETGHYYFPRLTSAVGVNSFRELFGDETTDYGAALAIYYREGPKPDWNQHYVTAYASSHPHEDWAETFAHYIHIVDTLDSAHAYGIRLRSEADQDAAVEVDVESYSEENFDRLWELWVPLTIGVNSLNRSMGHDDLYPFVLPSEAIEKLRFAHRCIRESARSIAV